MHITCGMDDTQAREDITSNGPEIVPTFDINMREMFEEVSFQPFKNQIGSPTVYTPPIDQARKVRVVASV